MCGTVGITVKVVLYIFTPQIFQAPADSFIGTLSRLSVFVLQRRGSIENIASVKERIENYMSATTAVAADGETSMQPPPIKHNRPQSHAPVPPQAVKHIKPPTLGLQCVG